MPENQFVNDGQPGGGSNTAQNMGEQEESSVDEEMLRNRLAQVALGWVGTTEGSPGHEQIVSIYNSIGPWPITMQSPWCAAFVSVCAYQAGVDDVVYVNSSCGIQINWYQSQGEFTYDKYYTPKVGDLMYFDWDKESAGAEHVGIVVSVGNNSFDVVDGNRQGKNGNPDYVSRRTVYAGDSYIYGFSSPNYSKISEVGVQLAYEPVAYTPPKTLNWENWIAEGQKNWLRGYRLEAGPEGEEVGFVLGEFNGPNNPPLRIQFHVEKGDFETQNNSTVKIWNLGEKHREVLSTPGCYVKLNAGYGAKLPRITQGIVARAIDSYDGGNLVTEIELIDIRRVIRDTYVAIPVQHNITGKKIIDLIVKAMGLDENSDVRYGEGLTWREYSKFAYVGIALKGIEKVCVDNGYVCTILNGMIDIHRKGQILSPRALVISAETGMIGNPKKLIETVNATYYLRGWQVEFMMNGAVDLGTLIKLESPFVPGGSGFYDVVELQITGDSMGEGWKCSAKLQDPYFGDVPIFKPEDHGLGTGERAGSGNFIGN